MSDDVASARERLLNVATKLFTEHGYGGTPVSRIVREAGVTMPVLYYHFGSKSDLLGAVIAGRGSWLRTDLTISPDRPFFENCRQLVNNAVEELDDVRDGLRLRLLLGFEAGPDASKLREMVCQQRQRHLARLAERMAEALPKASPRLTTWLAEIYLSGIQSLALELIGTNSENRFLSAKAENLVQTLTLASKLPDNMLPDMESAMNMRGE